MEVIPPTRYHLIPVRMTIIRKSTNNKCQEGVVTKEPSFTFVGIVNRSSHDGEQYGGLLKY